MPAARRFLVLCVALVALFALAAGGTGAVLVWRAFPTVNGRLAVSGLAAPRGLGMGPNGNLYVADNGANQILEITPSPVPGGCF